MGRKILLYFEDSDCAEESDKGYKIIYLPSATMVHYYHRTSKTWNYR